MQEDLRREMGSEDAVTDRGLFLFCMVNFCLGFIFGMMVLKLVWLLIKVLA